MNAEKRAELRILLDPESLTPGPWSVPDVDPTSVYRVFDFFGNQEEHIADTVTPEDARFIAAARTAVPELLDAIDRVLERHRLIKHREGDLCGNCRDPYPCSTVRAIEGAA